MAAAVLFSLFFESGIDSLTRYSFRYLIDQAVIPKDSSKLVLLLVALGVGAVLLTIMVVIADYLWAKLGALVTSALRRDLFAHVQRLSVDFFGRRTSGDVLSVFMADANEIETFLVAAVPYALLDIAGLAFSASLMATIQPILAVASLIAITLCLWAPRLVSGRAQRAAFETRQQEGRLSSTVQEALQSNAVIRVFGLERETARRFQLGNERLVSLSIRSSFLAYIAQRIPSISFLIVFLAIFGVSSALAFEGVLSIGEVVSFQVLVLGLRAAIENLTWVYPMVVDARAGLQRLDEIFHEQPTVVSKPDAPRLETFTGDIRFEHVSFAYPNGNVARESVHDVSLAARKGEFLILAGPSGSGKSTLLHLLLRLYDPTAGAIFIDGMDIRDIDLASLRSLVGFTSQDVFLFDFTIRDNVRMGKLDATDGEIWEALDAAEIGDHVRSLPKGLETVTGERGATLSGGERQRVALARALIRRPQILVLDEATSAQDPEREAELFKMIRRVRDERDMTIIAVMHGPQMTSIADRVVTMQQGRIESGETV